MREHARTLCERAVTLDWCAKQHARARAGMLWAAINAMPPYLLLHLQVFGDHLSMVIACTLAGTLMTVFTFGVIAAMWLLSSPTGVVPWAPWL
jgi:hypothetical protein